MSVAQPTTNRCSDDVPGDRWPRRWVAATASDAGDHGSVRETEKGKERREGPTASTQAVDDGVGGRRGRRWRRRCRCCCWFFGRRSVSSLLSLLVRPYCCCFVSFGKGGTMSASPAATDDGRRTMDDGDGRRTTERATASASTSTSTLSLVVNVVDGNGRRRSETCDGVR